MRKHYVKPILIVFFLLVASISLPLHPIAYAAKLKIPFSSGDWNGGAYVDDNGQFSYCLLSASYKSGIDLSITLNKNFNLGFLLINEKWSLPEDESYAIKLSIDGRSYGNFDALSKREHGILIILGSRNDIFEHLRSGNLLTLTTAKGNLSFDLVGTSKALQMLREYTEMMSVRVSSDKNPFAYSEKNPFSTGTKSKDKDRQEIIRSILSASGLRGFRFVDSKKPDIDYAWEGDNVIGFISTVPVKRKEEQLIKTFVGNFVKECGGTSASKYEDKIVLKSHTIHRAYAGCNAGEGQGFFAATVVESSSENIVIIHFAEDDAQGLKTLNDKIGLTFKNILE